jgi:hypothetical protein
MIGLRHVATQMTQLGSLDSGQANKCPAENVTI